MPNGGWHRVAFGDVVRQVRDVVVPEESGLHRYVAGEHMDSDSLRIRRWGTVGDGYLGPAFHMRFKRGHVLYGSRRTYLRKVAVAEFDGITANTTFVLEPKDPNVLMPELLPFAMQTDAFAKYSVEQSKGSVNPYVNYSDLATYQFALPPLEEQRRIATALASACASIESLRTLAFTHARVREVHRERLLSSRSFETGPLGALLGKIIAGQSLAGTSTAPTPSQFGVLKVSAVSPEGFRPAEAKTLLDQGAFQDGLSVHAGDLLMTRANTPELVAETCLVEDDHPNLMLCDKTLRLEPREGVDPYLLWECLQSLSVRAQIMAVATGTGRAMKNISQPSIRNVSVPYPADRRVAEAASHTLASHRDVERAIRERVDRGRALLRALPTWMLREAS